LAQFFFRHSVLYVLFVSLLCNIGVVPTVQFILLHSTGWPEITQA